MKQESKLLATLLFLAACSTVSDFNPDTLYKKELVFKVDGVERIGMAVASFQAVNKISLDLPDKPNLVKISTCHREDVFRSPGSKLEYTYAPVPGVEDKGFCLLEIAAFDTEGLSSWALLDFRLAERIKAYVGCNGDIEAIQGVGVCQARKGLIQTIVFEKEVKSFTSDNCALLMTSDKKAYTYIMGKDKCVYLFSADGNTFRLTTFGYDEVLVK